MSIPAKPAKFYAVMDSAAQRESAQNLMWNIKEKTRQNNGTIIEEALRLYLDHLKAKGGRR